MICSTMVERRQARLRRWLLWASTTVGAAVGQPASAQLAAPAPIRPSIDGNGVDLFNGTYVASGTPITLGNPRNPVLAYRKVNAGTGWADTSMASLSLFGNTMVVSFGDYSESFTASGSTYTSNQGNGSTLAYSSNVYTYIRADGTVMHFTQAIAATVG